MNPNQYQRLAVRTDCDESDARERGYTLDKTHPGLRHGVAGSLTEVGEIQDAIKRHIYYGQELDKTNLFEELGDCLWYIALICNSMGFELHDVMRANISKLRSRYPEKFDKVLSKEENRNREKERGIIEAERGKGTKQDILQEARNKARDKYLCPHCKNPISDEVVRKLFIGTMDYGGWSTAICVQCDRTFNRETMVKAL